LVTENLSLVEISLVAQCRLAPARDLVQRLSATVYR
jgi:hypothetical protein